eukprot:2376804-Karenia_brevis.AAC.1
MSMPITDGQWFLFHKHKGQQVWICPVCGGIFSMSESPFCAGMRVGPKPQDVFLIKAVAPAHHEQA